MAIRIFYGIKKIMDVNEGLNFWGLPIPNIDEYARLQNTLLDVEIDPDLNPFKLAERIIANDGNIRQVIDFDKLRWPRTEAGVDFSEGVREEYMVGIEIGFKFFIGVVTAIRIYRSGHITLDDFMDDPKHSDDVPRVDAGALKRINLVRSGPILLEDSPLGGVITERYDLAFVDAGRYRDKARLIGLLENFITSRLEILLSEQYDPADDRINALVLGFQHGAANGLEMYLQIAEEGLVKKIEEN